MPYTGPVGLSGLNVEYSEMKFTMKSGDILFLYTDGITEMANKEKIEFGIEPINQIIGKKHEDSAEDIMTAIMEKMEHYISGMPRVDDVSVIILKRV